MKKWFYIIILLLIIGIQSGIEAHFQYNYKWAIQIQIDKFFNLNR